MGYNKITNLLGKLDKDEIPKFTTIKLIEIFDQSNGTYNKNKDIRFTGKITATNPGNDDNVYNRKVSLKNSALFFNCTLKINSQLIEDAQDLDIVCQCTIYFIILKILEKLQDNFGIITQIYPNLHIMMMTI